MSVLSLVFDAIATEIRHWRNPTPAGAPLPADESPTIDQPVDQVVDRRWESSQFHIEQLALRVCLCGEQKDFGWYQCSACRPRKA